MAAQFSDDAYNKYLLPGKGCGTLIGNWAEERSIRDACGEGRSVPQRHIPRSGLLSDWTKVPSGGGRKQDNTFERVYGPKAFQKNVPLSKVIGAGEEDVTGECPIALTLQAEGRIARVGARELACQMARRQAADLEMAEEDQERERLANERSFDTAHATFFQKPDESLAEKASMTRKNCKTEILHGPTPDRAIALRNAGLDIQTNVHYSNTEGVTHARMTLMDPRMRNDMRASVCMGKNAFGKHSEFSKPIGECTLGLHKDDELEKIFQASKVTNPMASFGGAAPGAVQFSGVPALTLIKDKIHKQIEKTWGKYGYVTLRHQLYNLSDHEGFVGKADAMELFRGELKLEPADVSNEELDVYLQQLITMKKTELRISTLMSSLRPALPQNTKLRIMQAFTAMGPVDGYIKLGTWLDMLQEPELRGVLANAFGSEDESAVVGVPLNEHTLLELLSDLAPLVDILPMLPS